MRLYVRVASVLRQKRLIRMWQADHPAWISTFVMFPAIDRVIQSAIYVVVLSRVLQGISAVSMTVCLRLVSGLALAAGLSGVALADGRPGGGRPDKDWSLVIGGGGLLSPDYDGSDDYEVRALPYVSAKYSDWLSFSVPDGLKLTAINENGFRAGVLASYRFDRDEDDNVALRGLGDIDGTVELGGFAEYKFDALKLGLDVRQGLSDDTGLLATLSLRHESRIGPARISIGPQMTWGDDEYMQTYFGITPAQAAASTLGYAPYVAESGIRSYGLGFSAFTPVSDNWAITVIAGVSQITGDAADSPLVADEGSDTQYVVGVFAGYSF